MIKKINTVQRRCLVRVIGHRAPGVTPPPATHDATRVPHYANLPAPPDGRWHLRGTLFFNLWIKLLSFCRWTCDEVVVGRVWLVADKDTFLNWLLQPLTPNPDPPPPFPLSDPNPDLQLPPTPCWMKVDMLRAGGETWRPAPTRSRPMKTLIPAWYYKIN